MNSHEILVKICIGCAIGGQVQGSHNPSSGLTTPAVVVGGPLNQQQQSSTIDWRAALRVQVLQVDESWIAAPTDAIEVSVVSGGSGFTLLPQLRWRCGWLAS